MSNEDPFANDSAPSVSFKNAEVGTTKTLKVLEAPVLLQQRDYESGDLAFWPPNSDGTRNPKMAAVVKVEDTEDGEVRSVWAPKPSSLFAAIGTAQTASGGKLAPGDELVIQFYAEEPNKDKKKAAQKLYRAKVQKGKYDVSEPAADPWATESKQDSKPAEDEPPF
jgi:hypothetical protein